MSAGTTVADRSGVAALASGTTGRRGAIGKDASSITSGTTFATVLTEVTRGLATGRTIGAGNTGRPVEQTGPGLTSGAAGAADTDPTRLPTDPAVPTDAAAQCTISAQAAVTADTTGPGHTARAAIATVASGARRVHTEEPAGAASATYPAGTASATYSAVTGVATDATATTDVG